ncbi:PLP-dependent cysteine synthase family protein [Pseudohalocynthiibacter sp. F2068]|jgi:cysteine synthase|uniref:PLP-dependent cysteine synthase family protein n=1 Tax=Pseudohalocynthiibacter sp. F2068 TaxID=2926418 RepID=UPI001FF20773|nr:PLP-dependent cysteine synthase family protein [Pseudohalocynthiibacter sp. F2068]MCK0103825.1 PLP-dependent cysteine synthase family protein [Pseudohalocynthiibacter sp. F2068]
MNQWVTAAINKIEADYQRSADTHLFKLNVPKLQGVDIYLKDESTHPTGSLKHRLARSLFLYALCNGKLREGMTVIEASSGSTAVSEAYFAQMIGLPFVAIMPRSTAQTKIRQIELYEGRCHFVDSSPQMHSEAVKLASETSGYFMDQFTYAERATDWRGNNNIAESIFMQMKREEYPIPDTLVMSAGTGGTSATLGRYILYKGYSTQLVVVDPENSVFYDSYVKKDRSLTSDKSSRIEGIGRPKVEHSFQPDVIDKMVQVPDAASVATILWLEKLTGRKAGASTGTNLWGALQAAEQMMAERRQGSIVTLMCDSGQRYLDTYYDKQWVTKCIGDVEPHLERLNRWL